MLQGKIVEVAKSAEGDIRGKYKDADFSKVFDTFFETMQGEVSKTANNNKYTWGGQILGYMCRFYFTGLTPELFQVKIEIMEV